MPQKGSNRISTPLRVAVTGSRHGAEVSLLVYTLDRLHREHGIAYLIQGGASGVDELARRWADDEGVPYCTYHALWGAEGLAAGPNRNERMLRDARPDLLVAFPGGAGTASCVRIARRLVIPVLSVPLAGSFAMQMPVRRMEAKGPRC